MCKFIAIPLTLCVVLIEITDCTSSFDQRQTGDLNVQIGLKNIQLIALLKGGNEEYVDYDYAYDYSEMTIKPQNGTTPKPVNVTNTQTHNNETTLPTILADNTTEPTIVLEQHINRTQLESSTEHTIDTTKSNINSTRPADVNENTVANVTSENYSANLTTSKITPDAFSTTLLPGSPNNASELPSVSGTKCRRGFEQNNQGKCEYKVHGTSNALRRIVKLAQKIKIGREYTET